MNLLVSKNGTRFVELGGERAWLQRVKGDIVVSYQWLAGIEREPHPCMTLFPAVPKIEGGAYAIPQKCAYEYVTSSGNPTPYLLTAALNAAVSMGFLPDQSTIFRIVDIISDGLADLVRMPSDQPDALDLRKPVTGIEVRAKVEGKTIHEEVI